jgi:Transposase DDE domain
MAAPSWIPSPLILLRNDPEEVLRRVREGYIDAVAWTAEQVVDEHLRYALDSGLMAECAAAFPDPRVAPEVPVAVMLAASVAAAFQGEYALSQAGCALHSPTLLAELGLNAAWLSPGNGLSRRGTQEEAVFHSDTLRKLLLQLAGCDREAGRRPGESLLEWWNTTVGPAFLRRAGGGTGAWIVDATKLLVNLKNPRYEESALSKNEEGKPERGYKIAQLSALVDVGRLIVRVGWDNVRAADVTLARPLMQGETPLTTGNTLLHDRGIIDGATIACLKRDLGVNVVFPLKSDMLSYRLALFKVGEHPHRWNRHPTRRKQEIQKVERIGGPWEECSEELNACVVREWNEKKEEYDYWVFATTNLERSERGIIRDYEARSECEEDHRQTKGRDWEMDEYTSTTWVEILYHVLVVLFAYNLCQLYGHTEAGQRFAGKTKRARLREQRRHGVKVIVIVGDCYGIFAPAVFAVEMLTIEGEPKERLTKQMQQLASAMASE